MALKDVKMPSNLAEFQSGSPEIRNIEALLNALQNLQVQIKREGSTKVVTGRLQISGKSAILFVEL